MSISYTGDGLTIVIECDFVVHHDWMAFLCRYSMLKALPDARVIVSCNKQAVMMPIMYWPRRSQAELWLHKRKERTLELEVIREKFSVEGPALFIPPDIVCLRDFDEANLNMTCFDEPRDYDLCAIQGMVSSVKQQNPTVFVDYKDGWGSFVPATWINNNSVPLFVGADTFFINDMGVNEARLYRLWQSASGIFWSLSAL